MRNSRRIAGLLGPTLIAIALSEWINLGMLRTSMSAPVVYLNGTLLLVAGLSIVRVHNRWTDGWPVLVTLIGWLAILGGLTRMFAPVFAQQKAEQNTTTVLALLIVLLAAGIFLTFQAYGREDSKTAMQAGRTRDMQEHVIR